MSHEETNRSAKTNDDYLFDYLDFNLFGSNKSLKEMPFIVPLSNSNSLNGFQYSSIYIASIFRLISRGPQAYF